MQNQIENIYKPVVIFLCSIGMGISSEPERPWVKILRRILQTSFCIPTLITFINIVLEMIQQPAISQTFVAGNLYFFIGVVFKVYFFMRKKRIQHLLKLVIEESSFIRQHQRINSVKIRVYVSCIFLIVTEAVVLPNVIDRNTRGSCDERWFLKYAFSDHFSTEIRNSICNAVSTLTCITIFFNGHVAICAFALFYIVLMWNIKQLLKQAIASVKMSQVSFKNHVDHYDRIRCLLLYADGAFKELIFIITAFVSNNVYFVMFNVISFSQGNGFVSDKKAVGTSIYMVAVVFCLMYFMFRFASDIQTLNSVFGSAILDVPEYKFPNVEKIVLFCKVQQGLHLTVGGMFNISKGLFLTIIGTILTYCLLIRSLPIP